MKSVFSSAIPLLAIAGCASAPAERPIDDAAVKSFLERQLAETPAPSGKRVKTLDATADTLMKAPLERSDGLVAAMAERGL